MSEVAATTPTAPRRRAAADEVRTILATIDRGGLSITEHELRYQLARQDFDRVGLLERMIDLEQHGLIESTLCFRLTQQGFEQLPDSHQRPSLAGHRSDWRCSE
jgi:hypothetical protein